jgi:hypothetical protein
MTSKIDPELIRQLNKNAATEGSVQAIVGLLPDDPTNVVLSPERTEELAQKVLDRVKKHVGSKEKRYHVFKNLGSFVIDADPRFLRELISQPEVASAMANRQPESMLIAPIKKAAKTSRLQKKSKTR